MNRNTERKNSRKAFKSLGFMGLFLLAMGLMLPGQIFAQCNARMSASFEEGAGPFELGQEIPITLTIGMGESAPPTVLQVEHFQYMLDCAAGDVGGPGCTSQGNGVSFIGPVTTNCPLSELAPPPPPPFAILSTARGNAAPDLDIVDFWVRNDNTGDPSSNAQIRLNSTADLSGLENTCEVEFAVSVDSLAEEKSQDPVVQFVSVANLDFQCENDDSYQVKQELSIPIINPNAVFWVTKDFTDDNESPVDVHMRCNTGIGKVRDFSITDPAADGIFDSVGFVLYGIPSTGANCRIYEGPVPDGYADKYSADFTEGAIFDDINSKNGEGCFFEGVEGGEFFCDIKNKALPGMFTVHKEWVINNEGGDAINEEVEITITCDSEIELVVEKPKPEPDPDSVSRLTAAGNDRVSSLNFEENYKVKGTLGDGESMTVLVDTKKGPAKCRAKEEVQESGVESYDDCQNRKIPAGGKSECTFVNTVFFEGIPTLNHYGMALLAMLMLGLGAVGLRRFV